MEDDSGKEFIEKLVNLRVEGLKLKEDKHLKTVWDESHDAILNQLAALINLAKTVGVSIAEEEFERKCPLAGFETFIDFLTSKSTTKSLELKRYTGKGSAKTKLNRTTSKIDRCKLCGWPANIQGSKMVCTNPACGESEEIKTKASKLKVDSMKHTHNKIKMLIGLDDPPGKIVSLSPLIRIWLTDLTYLYDWLRYQETFTIVKNRVTLDRWIMMFRGVYEPRVIDGKIIRQWPMQIPDRAEYAWTFSEYKMLIAEFHAMFVECERVSVADYLVTNLQSETEDSIVEIMTAFYMEKHRLPIIGEEFEQGEHTWQVGNYINMMKLSHEESEIKTRLEEVFQRPIKQPGLMTNFLALKCRKVERHALTEACSYIIHRTFHVPYVNIPPDDIEKILEIIRNFDAFVRETSSSNRKTNSKLYVCKLRCILTLPYFHRYASIADYMTTKSMNTMANITAFWNLFKSGPGKELIDPYYERPQPPTTNPPADESGRQIFDFFK